jgi:hypothetical protein
MAVGTNENVKYQAAGNGSNTTFATLLVAGGASEIGVWITTAAGAVTAQVAGVDYTFSNLGGTATIVFQTAPPAGSTVTFLRKTAIAQALDLTYNERLPSIQIEAQLDALVRMIRDLDARATIAFPGAEPAGNPTTLSAPAQRKGKLLAFNNNTGAMEELPKEELLSEVLGDAQAAVSAASASAASASSASSSASASASSASSSASAASASAASASNSASAASASASAAAASAVLADVTNTSVNTAISGNPAASRTAMGAVENSPAVRRATINSDVFKPLRLMLDANRSTGFKNVGDSLGNGSDEFVALFANHIAAAYPAHRVVHRILSTNNDPALNTWADTVVQAASGERYVYFPKQRISQRCSTNPLTPYATATGTLTLTVTASGMTNSPKAVSVSVVSGDVDNVLAEKMRAALAADVDVAAHCDVAASLDRVILTKKVLAAHDSTFNLAISSSGLGITNDTLSDPGVYPLSFPASEFPCPTGDFEIEAKIRVASHVLANGPIVAWWAGSAPTLDRSFSLLLSAGSRLELKYYDTSGTLRNAATGDLSASLPAAGTDWWLKASVDVDNGAGGTTTTFYKSTDGLTWTLLTTLTIAGTGIFNQATSGASIGSEGGTPLYDVRVYQVRVRNGINGPITNNTAIDNGFIGATTNFLEFGGSPQVIIENYAHSGATTNTLLEHITGRKQYETATAAGTITGDGNATVTITGAGITGSPLAVSVAVLNGDTAAVWGNKVKVQLLATPAITALYDVLGYNAGIVLRAKTARANDATLNIALANGTCTGITAAPTSANTTAGLAPWPDIWMQNNGDAFVMYSGGMNDIGAIANAHGTNWTDAVSSIVTKLLTISPQAVGILLGTNPSVVVPPNYTTAFTTWSREQHPMRMARGAALARKNNWAYLDVWTAFNEDGRALNVLIPDGVHGSSTASSEIFAPVLTRAFDFE